MYYLWFVVCDPNLAGVEIYGQTTWKNPHGYLPGMMAPNLKFFAWMSVCYAILAAVWFAAYAMQVRLVLSVCLLSVTPHPQHTHPCLFLSRVQWKHVLMLQNCISLVIFLSMIEMSAWYFDFEKFNMSGTRPQSITLFAVLVGAARKSVARTLLLIVSMGYGVVKPTLGGLQEKVLTLAALYFMCSMLLDVVTHVGTVDDIDTSLRVVLVLPVAVLDAVYILWIFTSLSRTLTQLQSRRQSAKLDLYRKFTNVLALIILMSITWIGYEMWFKVRYTEVGGSVLVFLSLALLSASHCLTTLSLSLPVHSDKYNERWREDWITAAFWHVESYVLLMAICLLWPPHATSIKYAFSEDDASDALREDDALTEGFGKEGQAIAQEVFALEDIEDGDGKLE